MSTTLLILTFILSGLNLNAQVNQDSLDINQTISNLFIGMKTGDSSLVSSSFHHEVKLETIFKTKTGETKLQSEKLENFLIAVGTPHDGVWNEKIFSTNIQIDQIMAHVWTDYKFFLDDQFIHCGVNSFQLVKLNSKWKIVHLIDTRRVSGCN